jgi:hypothetical protein
MRTALEIIRQCRLTHKAWNLKLSGALTSGLCIRTVWHKFTNISKKITEYIRRFEHYAMHATTENRHQHVPSRRRLTSGLHDLRARGCSAYNHGQKIHATYSCAIETPLNGHKEIHRTSANYSINRYLCEIHPNDRPKRTIWMKTVSENVSVLLEEDTHKD